jgi:hypothetical protein
VESGCVVKHIKKHLFPYPTSFLTSTNSMTVSASGTSLSSRPRASLVLPYMIENMEERRAGWCEM